MYITWDYKYIITIQQIYIILIHSDYQSSNGGTLSIISAMEWHIKCIRSPSTRAENQQIKFNL